MPNILTPTREGSKWIPGYNLQQIKSFFGHPVQIAETHEKISNHDTLQLQTCTGELGLGILNTSTQHLLHLGEHELKTSWKTKFDQVISPQRRFGHSSDSSLPAQVQGRHQILDHRQTTEIQSTTTPAASMSICPTASRSLIAAST